MYKLQLNNFTISNKDPKLTYPIDICVFPKDKLKNPYLKKLDDLFDIYEILNNKDNTYCLTIGDALETNTTIHIRDISDLAITKGDYTKGWEVVKKRG